MSAGPAESQLVDQSWRCFAAGDLEAAIGLVQQAGHTGARSREASAALGFFLIQAGRLDEAAAVLLPAREREPHHAPLHWYAGYLFQRLGETAAAAVAFEQACGLDPSLDEAAFALAWALHDLGRIEEAAVWAAHALAMERAPQRLLQTAWLHQQLGHLAKARSLLHEAIRAFPPAAPEQARLHLHLSQCLARLGEVDESDRILSRALDLWPANAELAIESAWRLHERGDAEGALRLARGLVRDHADSARSWHVLGVLQQAAGDLQAADESLAQAQERDLGLTDALVRRAEIQREWKHHEGARWLLGLALDRAPGHEPAQELLAQVLLDLEENDEARRLLVRRLRAGADRACLWRLLAVTQWRRGRPRSAARTLNRALAAGPGDVESLRMQGWLAHERGDGQGAVAAVRALLNRVPDDIAAQTQAAFVFLQAGQVGEAQVWAERAVARAPDLYESWRALSQVRLRQRRLDDAQTAARQALRLSPGQIDCLRQLGWALMADAQYGQAQMAFLRACESKPADPVPRLELAEAQRRAGHFKEALEGVDSLLLRRPGWYPALLARARLTTEGGLDGAAQACVQLLRNDRYAPGAVQVTLRLAGLGDEAARRLLPLVPADVLRDRWRDAITDAVYTQGHASLAMLTQMADQELDEDPWIAAAGLYAASLASRSDPAGLARQSRDWFRGLKVRSGLARLPVAPRAATADGRPRIAYVASQLHQSLLLRVLAAHAADRAHVFVYTNQPLAGLPAHVHLQPLSPDTLAESCAANGVDVVIDAGGLHPVEGQFDVLQAYARRLAPVQVGWLGCGSSAGGLFDALLADANSVPPGQEANYEEAVLRLAGGQWCWAPPAAAPDVAPPPVLRRGEVTFGVTSRSLKLDAACLEAFARVVAATPRSIIRFIGEIAGDWPLRRDVLARMRAQGVACGRVFFEPFMPYARYLEWFARVDLVLDSFPGNGGLSLLDPLWMGVPVVTLAGGWAGARQGASVLRTLGLDDWVADTEEAFRAKAVSLACSTDALAAHRRTLRERIQGSPLVDGRRVASQIEAICAQLKARSAPLAAAPTPKERTRVHARLALDAWLDLPRTLELAPPQGLEPELSVIVVLFNQAGLSRRTLQALADQRGVCFETIVVDNASTDRTPGLLERLSGARVIRNASNLGFLRAARQGAGVARGRYLAFLNSDAILQDGALEAALAAMKADAGIGALGGRVVLTDGGLQEAGNTIFDDGSTGGIGRHEDAFGDAARAARSTDYVSGVLLVTPAPVWRMLGGFDEAFAPAYYEDTDYCLRVWQAGFRVAYEPLALLEHLEWGSAMGNSATVLMERNRALFRERHAVALRSQPKPRALSLDGDRWRSPDDRPRLPRVLFIDNEVPHMFKGGGLPRARLMLQALSGWPVTLLPLWGPHDHWHAIRESLPRSVEVALGHGLGGLEPFLERRRGVYDVLVVSRPPNLQALAPLRARRPDLFAGLRLVYDAEALFALREIAMAGVRGRPMARAQARARIDAEMALAQGASDVLVVSQRDARHFEAAGHRTRILSHGVPLRRGAPGPRGRGGLLFVGALHPDTPNEDGLLWFIREVMPLLRQRLAIPPVLSVVGVCLSDRVASLAGAEVKILGPQASLEPHYDAARVFVAPVRFAGGVPAKVIEAAAAGIPTVASALLVRQLAWREGLDILGARDARAFASAILRLLQDDAAWRRQQEAAWEQCGLRYDPGLFGETLRAVLAGTAGA